MYTLAASYESGLGVNTRVAVGRMSWLGLASGREHWPTPAFTEVFILCSEEQSPPPPPCTAPTGHCRSNRHWQEGYWLTKIIVLRWLGKMYGVNLITERQPIGPQFNR